MTPATPQPPASGQPVAPNLESGATPPAQPQAPAAPELKSGLPPIAPSAPLPTPAPAAGQPTAPAATQQVPQAPAQPRRARRPRSRPAAATPSGATPGLPAAGALAGRALPGPAVPSMGGGVVADIRVLGTQRIEPETVRSYLQIQPGEPWDAEKLDASLKALFATGLFADVNLSREGNVLVV
ncbi:MAG TPA: POTRA domain-containing protein, partial [Stellaceae bacterium]